jgi:hypothetical protein
MLAIREAPASGLGREGDGAEPCSTCGSIQMHDPEGKRPICSECGEPMKLIASLPRVGLRRNVRIFKYNDCARISTQRD